MKTPSASIQAWARHLVALEAANPAASGSQMHEAVQVSERLRICLTRFIGADGFTAILRRAVALARADVPSLQAVKVTEKGRLEGFQDLPGDKESDAEAATAITIHMLDLLVTFIGEPLTLRLARDAWPDASFRWINNDKS